MKGTRSCNLAFCCRLRKGNSYHWDLVVVAVINIFLTLFGLPMVHGALPHSPLHVKAMADTEDRVDSGHVTQTYVLERTYSRRYHCHCYPPPSNLFLLPLPTLSAT